MRSGTWVLVLVTLVLLFASIPASVVGQGSDSEVQTFTWTAPPSWEGPLALDLTFTFPEPTTCTYDMEAVWVEDEGAPVGNLFTLTGPQTNSWAMSGGASTDSYVHVDGYVDTREGRGNGRGETFFGIRGHDMNVEAGQLDLTVASPFYEVWDYEGSWEGKDLGETPLGVMLDCDGPFSVERRIGEDVTVFDQHSFEGQAAVSLTPQVPMYPLLGATANAVVEGTKSVEIEPSQTVLRVRGQQFTHAPGFGGVSTGAAVGQFALDHPDGNASWPIGPRPNIDYRGSGGAHEMELTRFAATVYDSFGGFLVGVEAVEDLDQAVGAS